MAVILLILKIIGIILLLLLGLLLLVLALVLFVPVRYRIGGKVDEEITVRIAVTWLLHLVSFQCVYEEGEMNNVLRILGIRKKGRKASPVPEDEGWDEPDGEVVSDGKSEPGSTEAKEKETPQRTESESAKAQEAEEPQRTELKNAEAVQTAGKPKAAEPPQESWMSRIFSRIGRFFEGIRARFKALKQTIRRIKEKLSDIKGILSDESHKIVLPLIWEEVKYLLLHFKFRKIKTDLAFSLGDPALTGQALGALSVLPFLYQYEIQIVPDFVSEKTYVKGDFEIKGYARGIHLARSVIRLIRKKEFRNWLKQLLDR